MIVTGVHRIDGIVNGTTNFILTRMIPDGASYAEALAEAQALGYAEADPTEDVTGADAAAKIAILASIAFHTRVRLEEVDARRHRPARPGRRGARRRAGLRRQADRLRPGRSETAVAARVHPCLLAARPPAGGRRGRLQRRHAARQLDPRGDPGGAGCRRRGDGHRRDRRPAGGDRHAAAPASCSTTATTATRPGCRPERLRSPCYLRFDGGRHARRAGPGGQRAGRPRRVGGPGRSAPGGRRRAHRDPHPRRPRGRRARRGRGRWRALGFSRSAPVVLPVLERA